MGVGHARELGSKVAVRSVDARTYEARSATTSYRDDGGRMCCERLWVEVLFAYAMLWFRRYQSGGGLPTKSIQFELLPPPRRSSSPSGVHTWYLYCTYVRLSGDHAPTCARHCERDVDAWLKLIDWRAFSPSLHPLHFLARPCPHYSPYLIRHAWYIITSHSLSFPCTCRFTFPVLAAPWFPFHVLPTHSPTSAVSTNTMSTPSEPLLSPNSQVHSVTSGLYCPL